VYADATDHWEYNGKTYDNRWCTIFRWRTAFQNDFAARMDWCVNDFDDANHNPVAVINGDETRDVLYARVRARSRVSMDATGSSDPDGDAIDYHWWIYPEAGTYEDDVIIRNATSPISMLQVPEDAAGKTIHAVLTLCDKGSPPLTSYRRVVLKATDE
jgi:hypothetical protein